MALIVVFRNLSSLASISDYEVTVFVNDRQISGPFVVKEHKRSLGWDNLVKKFVTQIIEKPLKR